MDTCGLERVERFRINLNEKNFASSADTRNEDVRHLSDGYVYERMPAS